MLYIPSNSIRVERERERRESITHKPVRRTSRGRLHCRAAEYARASCCHRLSLSRSLSARFPTYSFFSFFFRHRARRSFSLSPEHAQLVYFNVYKYPRMYRQLRCGAGGGMCGSSRMHLTVISQRRCVCES